jgi:predicted nucleic acid-binding protein
MLSVRLPEAIERNLTQFCATRNLTESQGVQEALAEYLVAARAPSPAKPAPEPAHLDQFLDMLDIQMFELSRPAARLADLALRLHRQRGGTNSGVLPDFFMGPHAQADGHKLLTRDAGRYRAYFPKLKLICP